MSSVVKHIPRTSCFAAFTSFPITSRHPRLRWQSTSSAVVIPGRDDKLPTLNTTSSPPPSTPVSAWTRLSASHLLRNVFLSFFLTRPFLLKPGLSLMKLMANSQSPLLNPDRNPLLRAIVKPLIYDQFCAGTNKAEIRRTIDHTQSLGFAGVILCYGREIQLDQSHGNKIHGTRGTLDGDIAAWRDGNLETLDMADRGEDNWLGIKYTGAGQEVTEALMQTQEPPAAFAEAMRAICEKAKAQKCRIWIDAEQQALQAGIDQWTIQLMREWNRDGDVLIYNTLQAYLKISREKLKKQLRLAEEEGWTFAVKLVRGAYIANDSRELIHDTKAETDNSYNSIVQDLMCGTLEGFSKDNFPKMRLFLAGHNPETVKAALDLGQKRSEQGELKVYPEFGQLQGMADDIGCEIIQWAEQATQAQPRQAFVPRVYKCLTWGSIQECMQYLVRRAVENSAAVGRMRASATASRRELSRRLMPRTLRPVESSP